MKKEIVYKGTLVIVNSDGTIENNGKVRKHRIDSCGYPVVSIMTENGPRSVGVHRLIAMAFVPNPLNLPEVDHINYDRKDFSVQNLRWVTHEENVRHSVCNLPDRHGENNSNYGNRKLSQFYREHPDIAKEKQGRPGKQNGRYKHGRYMLKSVTTIQEME